MRERTRSEAGVWKKSEESSAAAVRSQESGNRLFASSRLLLLSLPLSRESARQVRSGGTSSACVCEAAAAAEGEDAALDPLVRTCASLLSLSLLSVLASRLCVCLCFRLKPCYRCWMIAIPLGLGISSRVCVIQRLQRLMLASAYRVHTCCKRRQSSP